MTDQKATITKFSGCEFTFECPQKWDQFTLTAMPNVRHCDQCKKAVTLCADEEEFKRLAEDGACVAIYLKEVVMGSFRVSLPRTSPPVTAIMGSMELDMPPDSKLY